MNCFQIENCPLQSQLTGCCPAFVHAEELKVIAEIENIELVFICAANQAGTQPRAAADPFTLISGTTGLSGGVDGSLVMVKADRQYSLATLYATGRDTMDMDLELMFDEDTSTWQFLGHSGKERIQKRDRLLSELNDLLTEIGAFHGTASELMEKLCARSDIQIKSANALTRQLNPYRALMEFEYGIRCEVERTAKGRTLHLTKIANDDSVDTVTRSTDTVTTVTE